MKQITAIIKPFKLEEVSETLADCGVTVVTVTEAHHMAAGMEPNLSGWASCSAWSPGSAP